MAVNDQCAPPYCLSLNSAKVDSGVLEQVTLLAIEIAREGREGRRIGTIMTVGDIGAVLANSHSLILDPLLGHPEEVKFINSESVSKDLRIFSKQR